MKIIISDINQWLGTSQHHVQGILDLVYKTFSSMVGSELNKDIVVGNHPEDEDAPIIYYYNEPCTAYKIDLSLRTFHQPQIIYQFAHELCHAFCDFNNHKTYKQKWFEETLCEAASLSVLNEVLKNYDQTAPSLQTGKFTRPQLEDYINWRLNSTEKNRAKESIIEFLQNNIHQLENNRYLRDKNRVIALYLCEQFFYPTPGFWGILQSYNARPFHASLSFADFIHHWASNGETRVQQLSSQLGL